MTARLCARCGAPVQRKKADSIYCSKRCCQKTAARAASLRQRRARARRLECPCCGVAFWAYRLDQVYCSPSCRTKSAKERAKRRAGRPPDHVQRVCVVCGASFVTRRWNSIYCGKACLRHVVNKRRIDMRRRTAAEPRVSPELVARRAAAIRAEWTPDEARRRACTPDAAIGHRG